MIYTRRTRNIVVLGFLCICAYVATYIHSAPVYVAPVDLNDPNPLPFSGTLELEKMTWMEVRDRVRDGYTRIIIPTGGIEQNGPFVALNKHDRIVKEVSLRVAKNIGQTLVAPVVSFVPEGSIEPKTGHMRYPGTISLSEETFESLLRQIAESLRAHGFTDILFVGDSGDSQRSLERVAADLAKQWRSFGSVARYIPEFYDYARVREILQSQGIIETPEKFHEELAFSLQLLAIDPSVIRYEERLRAGNDTLGGVTLRKREQLASLGELILIQRVQGISEAIRR